MSESSGVEPEELDGFFQRGYTDPEWEAVRDVAARLKVEVHRETPVANRDRLLDRLGYSPSWSIDTGPAGLLQTWFTSCRRCGATVRLQEAEQEKLAPLDQHTNFHMRVEGVYPNGESAGGS